MLARAILLAAVLAGTPALAQEGARIDAERLNGYVRDLSSDAFEGRGPTTPGEARTIDWIIRQFQAAGAEPGGPDGAWTQDVALSRTQWHGAPVVTVAGGGPALTLAQGPDVLVASDRPVSHVAVTDAPLVFAGYGASAPERGWDDFGDLDLHGKILVVLVNDPDFEAAAGDGAFGKFDGRAMTFYGRWTYKFAEAGRRGAAGVLIVHDTPGAGYGWSVLQNGWRAPKFDIVRADPAAERAGFQGWIQHDRAVELFARAGLDFEALKTAARNGGFRPVALPGLTLSVAFDQSADRVTTHNVLARIPGRTHPDETVMYGAHWDGYGVGKPDASGDAIYNAAVDNATGVAALLELARAFHTGPAPERSVVFASWAAEEAGLMGATYYAAHPVWPLETTVANINMDSLLPGPAQREIPVIGFGKTDLDARLAPLAEAAGRTLIADPAPQAGGFYRSDHFPLAQKGVPPLFAAAGFTGASEASRDYVAHRYHQPSDQWDASWTMEGAAQDVQLLFEVGRGLANSRDWPKWTPGTEFEAARAASDGTRR